MRIEPNLPLNRSVLRREEPRVICAGTGDVLDQSGRKGRRLVPVPVEARPGPRFEIGCKLGVYQGETAH